MIRTMALAFAASLALAGAAHADTMTNTFGNTVTTQAEGGPVVSWRFNPDNTYAMSLPDGATGSGTWALSDSQLCVTPSDGSPRQCAPLAEGKAVGDTWTTTNDSGETVTVAITAGR